MKYSSYITNFGILFFLFLFSKTTFSAPAPQFEVVLRNNKFKPIIEKVSLDDLVSENSFDGKYFKIVKGKSDDAILFNATDVSSEKEVKAHQELLLKAATVYYHLSIARNYFVEKMKSSYVRNLPQLIIRIDHFNSYSSQGHFTNDAYFPQFNNALSIPAGRSPEWIPVEKRKEWNNEIWFRPSKKINIKEINSVPSDSQDIYVLVNRYKNQAHMQTFQKFLASLIIATENNNIDRVFQLENVMRIVGTSLFLEIGSQLVDDISGVFQRKNYFLETALVPEIIYHEFSHIALSDHMELNLSTPVIEGMADFFAGKIADSPKLATKIKKFSTYMGKNAEKKKFSYKDHFEKNDYAHADFVFGLLWKIEDLNFNNSSHDGAFIYYEMRKKLKTNSNIKQGLIRALLETCDEECDNPLAKRVSILHQLLEFGLE